MADFKLAFSHSGPCLLAFSDGTDFHLSFDKFVGGSPPYRGSYESWPKWTEQVFGTEGYQMMDDFTVHSIIKSEVDNDYGGITLSI